MILYGMWFLACLSVLVHASFLNVISLVIESANASLRMQFAGFMCDAPAQVCTCSCVYDW